MNKFCAYQYLCMGKIGYTDYGKFYTITYRPFIILCKVFHKSSIPANNYTYLQITTLWQLNEGLANLLPNPILFN